MTTLTGDSKRYMIACNIPDSERNLMKNSYLNEVDTTSILMKNLSYIGIEVNFFRSFYTELLVAVII